MKELIFSWIGEGVEGARILDLFSGTGSLGIEALSRGAKEVVFIEGSAQSLRLLERNVKRCGFSDKARILRGNVFSWLRRMGREGRGFDCVFADPPFKEALRERIVRAVDENSLLNLEGVLILEHEFHDLDSDEHGLELLKQRRFGHCVVSIYRRMR